MYFSETHRKGVKECSSLAYNLRGWGEVLHLFSMPLFILALIILPIVGYINENWYYLLYLFLPILMFVMAMFMRGKSEDILEKKGFHYDYETDTIKDI